MNQPPDSLHAIIRRVLPGWTLAERRRLSGGISFTTEQLTLTRAGATRRCVLRRPGHWQQATGPGPILTEFRLLTLLHARGYTTPEPLHLERAPDGAVLLMLLGYLEGQPAVLAHNPEACACAFAEALAEIHSTTSANADLEFLPDWEQTRTRWLRHWSQAPDDSMAESRVRAALRATPAPAPVRPQVLLHGDFWPGNVLWHDGRITGVVDWEDALRGPASLDVAVTRLDLLWCYGAAAMHTFTARYAECTGHTLSAQPYWDLWAATRPMGAIASWAEGWPAMGRPDVTEATLRADHLRFVTAALAEL